MNHVWCIVIMILWRCILHSFYFSRHVHFVQIMARVLAGQLVHLVRLSAKGRIVRSNHCTKLSRVCGKFGSIEHLRPENHLTHRGFKAKCAECDELNVLAK